MASKVTNSTQHIAATHLALADAITALAGAGAVWGWFINYLTPLTSFVVLLLCGTWYCVQISGSPRFQEWRRKRHVRHLARLRRKHRRRKLKL